MTCLSKLKFLLPNKNKTLHVVRDKLTANTRGLPIRSCDPTLDLFSALCSYIARWPFSSFKTLLSRYKIPRPKLPKFTIKPLLFSKDSQKIIMPGAHIILGDFNVMGDTFPKDTSIPPFMVSTTRGFLPRQVSHGFFSFRRSDLLVVRTHHRVL